MSARGRLSRWLGARVAPLRGGGNGRVLVTVAAGWFLVLGLRFVVPALLPQVKDTFGVGNAAAGLAVTVIWVTYAGMQLPAGALIDRVGERVLLSGSLVVVGASLLAFGVVPAFALFLLAAAVFGLGSGFFGPPRGTVLSNTFRENDGVAFGVTLAAGSVGAAALPFLATQVSIRTHWRLALAVFAPLFLVVALGLWWAVPHGRARDRNGAGDPGTTDRTERPDAAGRPGDRDATPPADETTSAGDVTATDPEPGDTAAAATDRPGVRDAATRRPVVVAAAGAAFMLFTFQGLTAFYTTYLVEEKLLAEGVAGGLFALLFLAGAGFQWISGRAADRFGYGTVLVVLALAGIPPLVVLPALDSRLALAIATVPIGVRLGVGPVVNAYVVGFLPAEVQGTTWGLVRTVFFAVGSTGSFAVGLLADAGQFDLALYALAALTLPAAGIFAFLPDRETDS